MVYSHRLGGTERHRPPESIKKDWLQVQLREKEELMTIFWLRLKLGNKSFSKSILNSNLEKITLKLLSF